MRVGIRRRPRSTHAERAASERLEHVLASLADAVVLTDDADRIVLFNPAAEQLTALSQAQVLQRACAEVFAATPTVSALVLRTRTLGQVQSCSEETLVAARRRVPVRLSCSPIWGPSAAIEGVALVIQDLSYRKKLEDEARRNETLARLGGLVAGLAHEIKNPLGGIKGAAQLLARRFSGEPTVAEYTGVMIREIDRLSRLVEQLLTLGSPVALNPVPLNVHKLLHEALVLLAAEFTARHIAVRLEIDPSLPDVLGEEAMLTHVFLNLAKNAVEAMEDGGTLKILTRVETDFHILRRAVGPGKFVRVEFHDTGPGFPEDTVDRVFEPFFTTKARGSGLGLAICERIVAAHGGDIRAANRPEGGGIVSVNLPFNLT